MTSLCSPCDGTVFSFGECSTKYSTIDCVKGRSYRLDEFMLGFKGEENIDEEDAYTKQKVIENNATVQALIDKVKARGNKLFYMVLYLSPADYHRFHSPAIHTNEYRRHIMGYLSPVKPDYVRKHKNVFKNNERVNWFGEWSQGFFFTSFVGALNVGSIKLDCEEDLTTNSYFGEFPYYMDKCYSSFVQKFGPLGKYMIKENAYCTDFKPRSEEKAQEIRENGLELLKGEMTGRFEMGSTIVLIFEGPQDTKIHLHEGQKLRLGEEIVTTQ